MVPFVSALRPCFSGLALGLACVAAAAAGPPSPAPLAPSGDGTDVIDPRTRLAWSRCVEGMHWNGTTCTGQRQLFDRSQASAQAQARAQAEGLRWRLPRANELRRLVDKGATPPGLDPRLFPAAPRDWHWSGSAPIRQAQANPYAYDSIVQGRSGGGSRLAVSEGWAVNLATGEARGDTAKASKLPVRLVRPLD
ncbi:hypothetical protein B2J86_17375 [Acidovorax sp. SRB_14]|uniref:Lcl C-terminal domain-containing protein n=1 Tax=Acidovorax sp. SRB_14 TaxID=1962699 RepID=UPI00146EA62B|nr:DUF1566 domain-containing protein [Acidovorax sp. SRB_14]NMM82672.1 hypothetical protein [Acidovorax sp. SRB_14]NMM91556.1 hypothetical protein [Rhodococcus sp. SRB_17]